VAAPVVVSLPPGLVLGGAFTVAVTALDPVTGDEIPDVIVSNVTLEVDQTAGSPDELTVGPFMLVPGPAG
jgi:hypothetical protein